MRLRTIALTLALACSFAAAGEAKKNVIRPASKSVKVKRASKAKINKPKHQRHQKHQKTPKIKHR